MKQEFELNLKELNFPYRKKDVVYFFKKNSKVITMGKGIIEDIHLSIDYGTSLNSENKFIVEYWMTCIVDTSTKNKKSIRQLHSSVLFLNKEDLLKEYNKNLNSHYDIVYRICDGSNNFFKNEFYFSNRGILSKQPGFITYENNIQNVKKFLDEL